MIINHSRVKNAEVTHISRNGLILMVGDKEYYLPYGKFPWFKRASVDDVFDVRLLYCIERFNACSLSNAYKQLGKCFLGGYGKYLQPIITQYFIGNKSEIWSLSLIVHSKG